MTTETSVTVRPILSVFLSSLRDIAVTTALSEKKDEIVEKEKQILLLETKLQDAEKDKLLQEQTQRANFKISYKHQFSSHCMPNTAAQKISISLKF